MPPETHRKGGVLLVGAGPGSADLLTVRAVRALEAADVVLYDALVCDEVVEIAAKARIRLRTGKRAGRPSMDQAAINRLMLRFALRGLNIVRLKGGDPSVFGRSGEEAAFLRAHGVAVDVVPGITAASAAAAQFGFPLTHRGDARRVVLATARTRGGAFAADELGALADPACTVVLYMGRDVAGAAASALIAAGRQADTPVLIVENAGRPGARSISSDLVGMGRAAASCTGATLIVVGAVTALSVPPSDPASGLVAETSPDAKTGNRTFAGVR